MRKKEEKIMRQALSRLIICTLKYNRVWAKMRERILVKDIYVNKLLSFM